MEAVKRFLEENGISEVESTFPDMTGNARGKFYPTQKFLAEQGGKIPRPCWYKPSPVIGPITTTIWSIPATEI